jgi:hypothetical protein
MLSLHNLAMLRRDQARLCEAELLAHEALIGYERAMARERWEVANARAGLGRIMTGLQCYPEAEVALLEAESVLAAAPRWPGSSADKCLEGLFQLYAAWDAAEPGKGYNIKATEWLAKWIAPK